MKFFVVLVVAVVISGTKLFAVQSNIEKRDHVVVSLVSSYQTVTKDKPFHIALKFLIDKDWHVYWKNPGDSGASPRIEWLKSDDIEISDFKWPAPYEIPVGPLTNYGYDDEVLLPMVVKVSDGDFLATAKASWLVCKVECIPGEAELKLEIPLGETAEFSSFAKEIEIALSKSPIQGHNIDFAMSQSAEQFYLEFQSEDVDLSSFEKIYFFPEDGSLINHADSQSVRFKDGKLNLTLNKSDYIASAPEAITGVLTLEKTTEPRLSFQVTSGAKGSSSMPYLLALIFAFVGGLILNLMPCVFPVISIKILGFVESSHKTDSQISNHGWMYTAGVLVSFVLLSGVLLILRALGGELGWGFQLQSPYFVIFMIALFFLLSLNLLGYFEIGQRLMSVGASASRQNSYLSSFYTGILATLVATPCTAPFMGAALGFAITLPSFQAVFIFATLGFGMASPYLLLSYFPSLIKKLPRPGPWMKTFKEALAFPMLLTCLWLIWVLSLQVQSDVLVFLLLFLTSIFSVLWMQKVFTAKTLWGRIFKLSAILVILLSSGYWLIKEMETSLPSSKTSADDHWIPYSEEKLQSLRDKGTPVFIDFTAAWCITCQVNKKVVLNTPEIQSAFKDAGVALMKADWTNQDPEITKALGRFQRNSVPLYILYPSDQSTQPFVLPEILTKNIVLENLNKLLSMDR